MWHTRLVLKVCFCIALLRERRRYDVWNEKRRPLRIGIRGRTLAEFRALVTLLPGERKRRNQVKRKRNRWTRWLRKWNSGRYRMTENGMLKPKRLPVPYHEPRTPKSMQAVINRRRRQYIGWWKWQMYHRYDAVSPIGSRKLSQAVRRRLKSAMGRKVLTATVTLLGCSMEQFRRHIGRQFSATMTWENYGSKWELDHLIPLSKFDLSKESHVLMACHYSNLRPLMRWANGRKSDRVIVMARQPQLALPIHN